MTQYPNITRAFEMSGAPSLQGLYQRRYRDEEMSGRWSAALKIGYESLEAEAYRRAFEGVDEPVFYQGEEVARVKKPSDSLMMFLLKGGMPEKYKDRVSSEVSGPGGGPIQSIGIEINDPIEVSMVYQKMIRGE